MYSEEIPAERWACACRGVEKFAQGWTAKAISLGWTFDDIEPQGAPQLRTKDRRNV
jgi:hypothetical protein